MSKAGLAGLVLAGGRGSRLGAPVPKPLVTLAGRPLLDHVLCRISPLVTPLLLSTNDPPSFARYDLAVLTDRLAGFQGPLAGLDAACVWLRRERPEVEHLLCLPGDTPFLPYDLAERLGTGGGRLPRFAFFRGRPQPTVGVWPLNVLDLLAAYLGGGGSRSIIAFAESVGFETIDFASDPVAQDGDPFFNVNTPEDLARAESWLSR